MMTSRAGEFWPSILLLSFCIGSIDVVHVKMG